MNTIKKRIEWIDIAKFAAIIAVLVNHTSGILYKSTDVLYTSFFSVSLFIFIMGVTSYISYNHSSVSYSYKTAIDCLSILRPYIIASFIYYICMSDVFNFSIFLNYLVHFNICGPFYFVFLYIQLSIIAPFLFSFFHFTESHKLSIILESSMFVLIVVFSIFTTNYTNILSINGGGGKLFGGSYLILFYIGMWYSKYYSQINPGKYLSIVALIISIFSIFLCIKIIISYSFQFESIFPFGNGINPPGVILMVYATSIALMFFFLDRVLNEYNALSKIKVYHIIAFMGKRTLYVFLYHYFFIGIAFVLIREKTGIAIENIHIKRIVYFFCMIVGSLIIGAFLECVHKKLTKIIEITKKGLGL